MCDYFDDFDREFMDDWFDEGGFDDEMEDFVESEFDDDLKQEDDRSDAFDWDNAFWIGAGLGFAYDEGRRERRKRKKHDSDDSDGFP